MSAPEYLEAAREIGCKLRNDAIWWRDSCTWLGDGVQALHGRNRELKTGTLGCDLYGGTAGVGLFMADLADATGEKRFAITAAAALKHALADCARNVSRDQVGFYSGRMGVAWAMLKCSQFMRKPELAESAAKLANAACENIRNASHWDVIGGVSGVAGGLLSFRAICSRTLWEDAVLHIQTRLLNEAANFIRVPSSKRDDGSSNEQLLLTGFAHGASGLACGLAEVFQLTGDNAALKAMEALLEFEREKFCADVGNWPDLRKPNKTEPDASKFMTAWCHGAPGIGLARIRLFQLFGDLRFAQEARTAADSTQVAARRFVQSGGGNCSLCHGVFGNADILDLSGDVLGVSEYSATASDVAVSALERFGGRRAEWPCGIPNGGYSPGLMIGTAGVGRFFLRRSRGERVAFELLPN